MIEAASRDPINHVNPLYIKLLGQIRHGGGDGEHRHHPFRGHADGVAGRPALAQILEPSPVILTQFCCAREAAGRKASGEARCESSGEADNEADAPSGTTRRVQAILCQGGVKRLKCSYGYAPRHFPGPDPKWLCQNGSI